MIVRNEEDGITQALASLQQIAALDEIVIIDTGSEDATVELARAEGATVHREPWQRDFSYHRNRCLDLCHNDWVFILDGDEVLQDVGHLDEFYAAPSGDGLAMNVSCVGVTDVVETFLSVRSFDRRAGRWQFPVHNQLARELPGIASTLGLALDFKADR
jgi:glycosyltransferase involved in cell wall biosynthesis